MDRPEAHGALVASHPRFPRSVQSELIGRRVRLLSQVGDQDVLDLSQPAARAAVVAAAHGYHAPSETYCTVVSFADLVRFPDLVLALTGIDRLLAADGQLLLVEPVHHPGTSATVLATIWSAHRALAGAHLERDVTLAVRTVGLDLTDLERFTMPTTIWPLRRFIQARARRLVEAAA